MSSDPLLMRTSLCLRLFSQDLICFQRYELLRAIFHRYVIGYILLVAVVISLLDLRGTLQPISPREALIINSTGTLLATMVHLGLVTWREWRHRGRSPLVVNVSPILMLGSFVGLSWAEALSQIWLGQPALPLGQFAVLWMFHYFLAETFIGLVMFLVMPKVLSDLRGVPIRSVSESHRFTNDDPMVEEANGSESAEMPRWSDIGGRRIALSDLRHIEAEGNYIRVTTTQKRLYLPGPFGPVAESLPPDLGLRVSRSDWVARDAVAAVQRDGKRLRLRLIFGYEVLVPKNRHKAVLAWLDDDRSGAVALQSTRMELNINPNGAVM